MEEKIISTVTFRSNLQPVNGLIKEDRKFLAKIHDPFALEMMKKAEVNWVTEIQRKEFHSASMHCAYAFPNDYPFGTVVDDFGKPHVVCKCTNVHCIHFSQCRPDFDENELDIAEDNVSFQKKIDVILENLSNFNDIEGKGDAEAVSTLLSQQAENEQNPEAPDITGSDYLNKEQGKEKKKEQEKSITQEEPEEKNSPPVTFDSFVEVQQEDIICLNEIERTVVNAGPGTGKTWTLIEKIKYMLSVQEVEPENILVLCFSRAAVEVVRNRLEEAAVRGELPLRWHEIDVRTFDSFATYLLAWLQENKIDILPNGFNLEAADYNKRVEAATMAIDNFSDIFAEYRHVIVDEVQDLVGIRAEMVLTLLKRLPNTCGFTILGDSCQALYDYLAIDDDSVMNSTHFYREIFDTYRSANYYALTQNYRQRDDLGTLTVQYREAILTGTAEERTREAKNVCRKLPDSGVDLKHFSRTDAAKFQRAGTLGILTRTNGQALQISSWLRAEGITHVLQKPLRSQELAAWIAQVVMQAETGVIDFNEFASIFKTVYPGNAEVVDRYWNALLSTQRDETKRHYEIEDLLRGLIENARNPLLFEEPVEQAPDVIVSNIHRAKGREFDTVFVLDDVLEAMTNDEEDDILEHRVCYVALTRPKKQIEKVTLKTQFIFISKDEERRCFKAGGRIGHKYLSHIEVGYNEDINMKSFADSQDVQQYIQKMSAGSRLMLLRCQENTKPYVIYKLVPEEDQGVVLGYTTPAFARSIEKAIQRIYNNHHTVTYKYYPEYFDDIYFEGLYTCVSSNGENIDGAMQFGDMFIWYGLEINGFAHRGTTHY